MRLNAVPLNVVPLNNPSTNRLVDVAGSVAASFTSTATITRTRGLAGASSVSFTTTAAADRVKLIAGVVGSTWASTAVVEQTHQLAGVTTVIWSTTLQASLTVLLGGAVTVTFSSVGVINEVLLGGAVTVSFAAVNSVFEAEVKLGGGVTMSWTVGTGALSNILSNLSGSVSFIHFMTADIGVGDVMTNAGNVISSWVVTGALLVNNVMAGNVSASFDMAATALLRILQMPNGAVSVAFTTTANLSPTIQIGGDAALSFTAAESNFFAIRELQGVAISSSWVLAAGANHPLLTKNLAGTVTGPVGTVINSEITHIRGLAGGASLSMTPTAEIRMAKKLFGAAVMFVSAANSEIRIAEKLAGAVTVFFCPTLAEQQAQPQDFPVPFANYAVLQTTKLLAGAATVTFGAGATMFPNPGEPAPLFRIIFVDPKDRDIFVEPKDRVILFLPDDDGATVLTKQKQPSEIVDYDIDFRQWFGDGPSLDEVDTVVLSVTETGSPPDLEFGPGALPDYSLVGSPKWVIKVWVGGGVDGVKYQCTAVVTTTDGRVEEVDWFVKVKEQ